MQYTFGLNLDHHDSQLRVVQGDVTRNIGHCFGEIYDEIETACNDVVFCKDGKGKLGFILPSMRSTNPESLHFAEWCTINAHDAVMTLVNRVGNRYFVGLPLCESQPSS